MNKFDAELEKSFRVKRNSLIEQFRTNLRSIAPERITIEQKWITSQFDPTSQTVIRSRIRKTTIYGNSVYSHDTKYYFDSTPDNLGENRIELRVEMNVGEYNKISSSVPGETVNKTRLYFTDAKGMYTYTADVYPNNPIATIEIEFQFKEQKDKYTIPEWLQTLIDEVKE